MKSLSYVYRLTISGYVVFEGVCTRKTHLLSPSICRQQHPNPPCFFTLGTYSRAQPPDILNRTYQWYILFYIEVHSYSLSSFSCSTALDVYVQSVRSRGEREFATIYPILLKVLQSASTWPVSWNKLQQNRAHTMRFWSADFNRFICDVISKQFDIARFQSPN